MNDMKLPTEWTSLIKAPRVKAAFFSKIESKKKQDCKNCGGLGEMYLFIATSGPFKDVPKGIAKWAGDRWWAGENFGGLCPVCKGTGADPDYKEEPEIKRQIELPDFRKVVEVPE